MGNFLVYFNGGGAVTRLKFSHFDGNDPTGWIYWIEQFFKFNQIPEILKVPLASYHLEMGLYNGFNSLKRMVELFLG